MPGSISGVGESMAGEHRDPHRSIGRPVCGQSFEPIGVVGRVGSWESTHSRVEHHTEEVPNAAAVGNLDVVVAGGLGQDPV